MLARNFLVLERESGKLAGPETDAAEIRGREEISRSRDCTTFCKAPHLTHAGLFGSSNGECRKMEIAVTIREREIKVSPYRDANLSLECFVGVESWESRGSPGGV
jgi:hypothetical protein